MNTDGSRGVSILHVGGTKTDWLLQYSLRLSFVQMVRSTIVVRASDALPLAASVDDEQVAFCSTNKFVCVSDDCPTDRTCITGAQATSKTYI